MAWLQNLAGKAEDLLNKVDQNAATVLTISKENDIGLSNNLSTNNESNVNSMDLSKSLSNLSQTEDMQGDNVGISFNVQSEKSTHSIEINPSSNKSESFTNSIQESFILAEGLYEKIAKLEFENQDLNRQLLNLQHLYSELRNNRVNLESKIQRLNEELDNTQKAKEQYKVRAYRILQEKEKFIKENDKEVNDDIYANYNENLKEELKFQQDKNAELVERNKKLTHDIQSLQMQHQIIQNGLHQSNLTLEENLLNEKKYRKSAEDDCALKLKEVKQDLSKLQELLSTKDTEIIKLQTLLKKKLTLKTDKDVENQIESLTQTLMLKQSSLETATTERNALKLQVEKLEKLYKDSQLQKSQVKIINVNDNGDLNDRPQIPHFLRASLLDAGVTRRVKHAYSVVDAVSIRTGIFLRRYPVARVCIFCYMVLLHIWVLIILFLYAPSNR
ncbi:unnamed protein product [Brassicogethes aeneus]|uniref:Golgin-84 n=1 Tax=Brassicogethes aeneus TaxID=1431903 RepID=A0A9P0ARR3_BRAAE|nr:unnamed protein product [Brassicogethes aeneus]